MLRFQFVRPDDAPKGELADRNEAFSRSFGDDLRPLAIGFVIFRPVSAQASRNRFK